VSDDEARPRFQPGLSVGRRRHELTDSDA
jgi:hypothetical protein